ncbi:MAG TPA: HD domain-containing phosphohydrolase [Anaerolineaceae bacterium]|nr:HD domain-containing phosphohydrolase [Anaerolineaceae bacterium]
MASFQSLTNDLNSLRFEDLFDIGDIQAIQDTCSDSTGVPSVILALDGRMITRPSNYGNLSMEVIQRSTAGLAGQNLGQALFEQWSSMSGILVSLAAIHIENHPIANWLIGPAAEPEADLCYMVQYGRELGFTEAECEAAFQEINRMSAVQFDHVQRAFQQISLQISKMAIQIIHQARAIVEREQAQVKLTRVNRLYSVVSQVSQAAVKMHSAQELYDKACAVLFEEGQFDMAWIALFDPVTHEISPGAWAGNLMGYLEAISEGAQIRSLGEGPMVLSIRENRLVYCNDVDADPAAAFWRDEVLKRGFHSMASIPLTAGANVIGAMLVYSAETGIFDAKEISLLLEVANVLSFALESIEKEKRRKEAEAALQASDEKLRWSNQMLFKAYDETIEGWSRALDLRDHETEGHSKRVTEMALRLARFIGVPQAEYEQIRRGALLHDIGKVGVPDNILFKPGGLTAEEWQIMKQHPQSAYNLLVPIEYLKLALDIPYCHHEKWDGSGYPRGLKGDEIPLAARIFAVVDVWDALQSDRPYRKGWPAAEIVEYIRSQSGCHFDPKVVETFLAHQEDIVIHNPG